MFRTFFCFLVVLVLQFSTQSFSQILFTAKLDGSQEAPTPISTSATATAWAVLNPDMTTLTYHVTYAQLDSTFTQAHFHLGASGVFGGVVFGIPFNGKNTASGQWTNIPDSIVAKLLKEEIYINIHSSKHPTGEIRGQLIPVVNAIGFTSMLDPEQENSSIVSNGSGTGWAILKDAGTEIEYSVTVAGLSSNLTMAHFHNAPAGSPGGVVHGITFADSTSKGSWTGFAENMISEIIKNRLYFNVHTGNYGGGEIRGQLIHQGEIMFAAKLEGSQEAPTPVTTDANGTAWGVLNSDKTSLRYQVTYAQLDSTFTNAHFHLAPAGVFGGVVFGVSFNGKNTVAGEWPNLPDSIVAKLVREHIYFNVHSAKYGSGEIRGQMENVAGLGFTSNLNPEQENSSIVSNGSGTGWAVLSNSATSIDYNVTVAGLSSNLTMAHFHNAIAGVGGGVVHPITFSDSSSSGTWTGFTQNIISELLKNRLYFNVHSTNNPGGEIRGQINFSNIVSGNIPVELISFSASIKDNSITLSWTTATEINNRGFEIQRRNENNTWLTIGFIQGKGTTTEVQSYSFIDENLTSGKYSYRFKQVDFDGRFEYSNVVNVNIGSPLSFELSQNYPNPFNPTTTINFTLPEKTNVSLKVYNILGSQVAQVLNEVKDAGSYSLNFNGEGLSSGIYIYKISTGSGKEISRKMTLLK